MLHREPAGRKTGCSHGADEDDCFIRFISTMWQSNDHTGDVDFPTTGQLQVLTMRAVHEHTDKHCVNDELNKSVYD